jgi:hypothetical protein
MKNKKIAIAFFALIAAAVVGAALYWAYSSGRKAGVGSKVLNGNYKVPANGPENRGSAARTAESDGPYVGDDFEFIPPQGWIRTEIPSTLVAYRNQEEKHEIGSAADKINFKSYFAVSFDSSKGQSIDQIMDLVKLQTSSVAPSIIFGPVTEKVVNGMPMKTVEADLVMQDTDFKVLMAVILNGSKYYTVSFNTTAAKWGEYRDVFYGVLDSFNASRLEADL